MQMLNCHYSNDMNYLAQKIQSQPDEIPVGSSTPEFNIWLVVGILLFGIFIIFYMFFGKSKRRR